MTKIMHSRISLFGCVLACFGLVSASLLIGCGGASAEANWVLFVCGNWGPARRVNKNQEPRSKNRQSHRLNTATPPLRWHPARQDVTKLAAKLIENKLGHL